MTMTVTQAIITVGIVITGTVFTRFIAYIAFPEGKKIPPPTIGFVDGTDHLTASQESVPLIV